MNELRRMAYLEALEIDCYVSRTQLPGAAQTQRLAILAKPLVAALPTAPGISPEQSAGAVEPGSPLQREGVIRPDFGLDGRTRKVAVEASRGERTRAADPLPRFSLSTIVAGKWLWLEDLAGMPLATAQVQLVQAMARALAPGGAIENDSASSAAGAQAARPYVAQFDWPIHANRQLDQGEDAARASLAAFVSRTLEQRGCRGLVLLGQSCVKRVPLSEIGIAAVCTVSSAEMLADPALKRQAWRDLQPLREKP